MTSFVTVFVVRLPVGLQLTTNQPDKALFLVGLHAVYFYILHANFNKFCHETIVSATIATETTFVAEIVAETITAATIATVLEQRLPQCRSNNCC